MLLSRPSSARARWGIRQAHLRTPPPQCSCLRGAHRGIPDSSFTWSYTVAAESPGYPARSPSRNDGRATHARRFELRPLGASGMISLVQDLLGLDIALATTLEQRCSGNPRFAVQLVSGWVERGLLQPSPSGFRLRDGADIAIPPDMLSLWQERLESVLAGRPESDAWAIEVAAMLGTEVQRMEWEDVLRTLDVIQ